MVPHICPWPYIPDRYANGWDARIRAAVEAKGFSIADLHDVQEWDRCALGELCALDGLDPVEVIHENAELAALGGDFAERVAEHDYCRAMDVLEAMEETYNTWRTGQ